REAHPARVRAAKVPEFQYLAADANLRPQPFGEVFMADFLALDWEEKQLVGLEATVSNDGVRAIRAVVINWPSTIDPEKQPQEAGEFLRRELQRIGVTAKSLLVAFPRERAAVRQIEVPDVPDE